MQFNAVSATKDNNKSESSTIPTRCSSSFILIMHIAFLKTIINFFKDFFSRKFQCKHKILHVICMFPYSFLTDILMLILLILEEAKT